MSTMNCTDILKKLQIISDAVSRLRVTVEASAVKPIAGKANKLKKESDESSPLNTDFFRDLELILTTADDVKEAATSGRIAVANSDSVQKETDQSTNVTTVAKAQPNGQAPGKRGRPKKSPTTAIKDVKSPKPETTARKAIAKNEPSDNQLSLINKVFADDEDDTQVFYVATVKYYPPFKQICCYCINYNENMETNKTNAEKAIATADEDFNSDFIFDCDYVSTQIADYIKKSEMTTKTTKTTTTKVMTKAAKKTSDEKEQASVIDSESAVTTKAGKRKRT
eukprot:gene11233-23484_t